MDLEDLILSKAPPPNRVGKCVGDSERHFPEGAVMLAYAIHLMRNHGATKVLVHPDGEHGKQFDFRGWLERRGFQHSDAAGLTTYRGTYTDARGHLIVINPKSGMGDVVAEIDGVTIAAECKGGIINTRHSGQVSRLYRGLCETVGLLMASPSPGRQVAVVPHTTRTAHLAARLAPRCRTAGIEIVLVGDRGEIIPVS